ncbi:MAG: cation diffusion facilitator family transporter [Clostridiales bacterium]|nr:cation diffusion facilitator family transporter [Clostridiales bacterium]MCF8021849.1 cation diffusion facilitator family transporter [Clostridiales bacterium]
MNDNSLMQSRKRILYSILLVGIILCAKFIGAFITNSLALFSDCWHLMTDLASLLISWWGLKVVNKPETYTFTFGYYRHSILTALINNVSLMIIAVFILYKSVMRYLNPVEVEPEGMMLLAVLGLVINSIIVFSLKSNSTNLNVKSAFLHFIGDALADVGVLVGGLLIYFTGWTGVDTLLSAVLGCFILKNAVKMSKRCINIFLEAAPDDISINKMKERLKSIEKIYEVTDLHVWSLTAEVPLLTAHVCVEEENLKKCEEILFEIQSLLKNEFNIEHSTIQFEHAPCSSCYFNYVNKLPGCVMCIDSSKSKQ